LGVVAKGLSPLLSWFGRGGKGDIPLLTLFGVVVNGDNQLLTEFKSARKIS
jgi:hypothetical protein